VVREPEAGGSAGGNAGQPQRLEGDQIVPVPQEIEFPEVPLRRCTTEEYCTALHERGELPFWWWGRYGWRGRNFSLPFRDRAGHWWYEALPGFAWPVEILEPLPAAEVRVPLARSYWGYQHAVPEGASANGKLVINTIMDLAAYGPSSINDKRRNAVRKGLRSCDVVAVEAVDERWLVGAAGCWRDLVQRSGWNRPLDAGTLRRRWEDLFRLPGATTIMAFDRESGQVAGFLITKVYGRTAYVDTLASASELLHCNPNDALVYTFVRNAQRLPGVAQVHYAIKSTAPSLEKFKVSLGFEATALPARVCTRVPGALGLLRLVRLLKYKQLMGQLR